MTQTTTIRVSKGTHAHVTRLARERHETIDDTVRAALRALRQDSMAVDMARDLDSEESEWLDADAG
ncbi:hypothetical protein [Mobilicoccus massiliensis]|uniref:hypothetical protein n=1 Tax=Mobilicoccus massiliensis TaxID=1522310 RepID=UPI00058D5018|nr:hypothetical protein [Mobilicoccus massiliensis]